VVWAAFFNFLAIFIFQLKVAATIGKGTVDPGVVDHYVIFGALVGAIAGGAVLGSGESMHLVAGGAVALALAIVAVLLGLAATMTARAAAAGGLAPAARPVLLVVPVLAAVGPVAYLLCLAAQG